MDIFTVKRVTRNGFSIFLGLTEDTAIIEATTCMVDWWLERYGTGATNFHDLYREYTKYWKEEETWTIEKIVVY